MALVNKVVKRVSLQRKGNTKGQLWVRKAFEMGVKFVAAFWIRMCKHSYRAGV